METKKRMTIHRALSELKLLDSRILKQIEKTKPIGIKQPGKLVNNFYSEEAFIEAAKENHQSITDLINRKNMIKFAITKVNSNTFVKIGDEEMTISDAINYKSSMYLIDSIIDKYTHILAQTKSQYNLLDEKVQSVAISLAEKALQKDNVKIGDNDASNIINPYLKNNKCSIIDPLQLEATIETMEEYKESFMSEVDAVLSEINATTFIEI
ncbi:MAG: hypothetical protein PF569_01860 [Candidatus Woesearchaeota archaeon]|jgi:hypothetical protein|nr:hypothetical protein [Candidatus Woesearchaeota archaeon]